MHTVSISRMPSSRATMAAGTSPPRVMHTSPSNGPAPGEAPGERAGVTVELVPGDGEGFLLAGIGHEDGSSAPDPPGRAAINSRCRRRAPEARVDTPIVLRHG